VRAWLDDELPFLVATQEDGAVVGFARVAPYSDRCVYAGVGEHGVYVARAARGNGIGRRLLDESPLAAVGAGLYTLTSQVFSRTPRREAPRAPGGGLRLLRGAAPPRPPRRRVAGLRARRAAARRRRPGRGRLELLHPRVLRQEEREDEGQDEQPGGDQHRARH